MKTNPVTVLICVALLFGLVPVSAGAADAFIIISDVDDTVKVTNVGDKTQAIRAALGSKLAFAGMSELYRQLLGAGSPPERLTFISGSPHKLETKVDAMLRQAGFPAYTLVLRAFREWDDPVFDYKVSHLNELYGSSDARFLMIGDDTEKDPDVYLRFSKSAEDPIYIRRVSGKALPSGCLPSRCISFVTAYDIAVREFQRGQLNESQAAAVGADVLTSSDRSLLPSFVKCPTRFEPAAGLPDSLATIKAYIDRRVSRLCAGPRDEDD